MKSPLYDHLWTKIIERNSMAESALKQKIKEHEEIYAAIQNSEGKDAANNVMDNGLIGYCLERCLEHLSGSDSINDKDYFVFYGYASKAVKESEKLIDEELSYLDL
ncbi:hypothetical protein NAV31_01610 [Pseudomonas stutzeri]|nr:hypothetical protein [Stutzerimonas degradans]